MQCHGHWSRSSCLALKGWWATAGVSRHPDRQGVRVDTTVVEADIKYPTDSGLLTAATCRIASRLRRLVKVGVKVAYTDRTAAAAPVNVAADRGYWDAAIEA